MGCEEKLAATYSSILLRIVPLATKGLTAEFGMGSGVSPSLWPPENLLVEYSQIGEQLKTTHETLFAFYAYGLKDHFCSSCP